MIRLLGSAILISNPDHKDKDPKIRHKQFYLKLSYTVFSDLPPYFTIYSWMIIVPTNIIKNNGLLKKFSNTFAY